ncbi:DUF5050 domain-containing protein [Candidatus Saccharibacteria bacterium]|nr:DUF5050 domain-containing protein [Candidatus Saccharibacteria bacterium]
MTDKKTPKNTSDEPITPEINELMGPTPETALPQSTQVGSEPGSAPIIPDAEFPKEVFEAHSSEPADPPAHVIADSAPEQIKPEDPAIDEAVSDIVREESDTVLAKEDEDLGKAFVPIAQPHGFFAKLKNLVKRWWSNPKARWATLAGVVVGLLIIFAVPTSRYFVLNTVGVRAAVQMIVVDEGTQQPLKNVQVSIDGKSGETDTDGKVRVAGVKLGSNNLHIEKVAFAPYDRTVTLGWGSNPLGDIALKPTGAQYTFNVKEYLSEKPLSKVEAVSGQASAVANEQGEIVLTVDLKDEDRLDVTLNKEDYRSEKRTIATKNKEVQKVSMVPARKHVFVSKRSGKFDLYKIDIDGKNEAVLLPGSGTERDDIVVAPHASQTVVALVSTRENQRNDNGFLLSNLQTVDVETGENTEVAASERVQIVDWVGDRLVYVQIDEGVSANSPRRHRLMSYDYKKNESTELATSNYFNDVMVAKNSVYYAPSSANQKGTTYFYRVNPDGSNKQTILDKEVWNIFRVDYDKLNLAVGQKWYEYTLGDGAATQLDGAPGDPKNKLYRDDAEKKRSLWVDQRDGKGVLLSYDTTTKQDKIVKTQSGLRNPINWLQNDYAIYRINTDQETADYVLNLAGGQPRKIQDVTNTGGIDRWYYYQ